MWPACEKAHHEQAVRSRFPTQAGAQGVRAGAGTARAPRSVGLSMKRRSPAETIAVADSAWHTLPIGEVVEHLSSHPKQGLGREEAAKRLIAHGPKLAGRGLRVLGLAYKEVPEGYREAGGSAARARSARPQREGGNVRCRSRGWLRRAIASLVVMVTLSGAAWAREGEPPSDGNTTESPRAATPEAPEPPTKTPPYSVPWQLRPIVAPTVLRSDTSIALYEDVGGQRGSTVASLLTASYRIPGTGPASAGLAPLVRVAVVGDDPAPGNSARGGVAFVNPLVGAAYAIKLDGGFRLNAFLGATIPIGGGGGDSPSPGAANSRIKGVNARAQLDNALFAVNDFTLIPGFGAAYVSGGLTVQVEMTLLQLMRVRGEAAQREASKTNVTTGLHVGYFFLPELSMGGELRYQRWLNAPLAVEA